MKENFKFNIGKYQSLLSSDTTVGPFRPSKDLYNN